MNMCSAMSTCRSDLILHSRVRKEPIMVVYTAFSKRQLSSFMRFYNNESRMEHVGGRREAAEGRLSSSGEKVMLQKFLSGPI